MGTGNDFLDKKFLEESQRIHNDRILKARMQGNI